MPEVVLDGCRLHYSVEGRPRGTPCLLSHSLGATAAMWEGRSRRSPHRHRAGALRYARAWSLRRSAGRLLARRSSGVTHSPCCRPPAPGEAADVCGISLGGQTAMWLGIHAPERVRRLVLANTGARIGTADGWDDRIRAVRAGGFEAIIDGVIERSFTARHRAGATGRRGPLPAVGPGDRPVGYLGCSAAIRDVDLREDLHRITARTLRRGRAHRPVDAALRRRVAPAAGLRAHASSCSMRRTSRRSSAAAEFAAAVSSFLLEE